MKFSNIINTIISVSIILATTSCSKTEDIPTIVAINTITDKIIADTSFSLLKEATIKAGLDTRFKTTGPFTVFAPDNNAFINAGFPSSVIAATSTSPAFLSNLLLYHTVSNKLLSANIAGGINTKTITTGGDSIYINKSVTGAIFVNGIQVTATIDADNGIIYKTAKILKQPTGNIFNTTTSESLDSLVVAVLRVNAASTAQGGDPTLAAKLRDTTLTIFAPSNAAFRNLLTALSLQNINQIPLATLTTVLKYHLVKGRTFSLDLLTGNFTMLPGTPNTTAINIVPAIPTITGRNSILNLSVGGSTTNTCNIVTTNIMCRNGVMHLIDGVLLP